MEAGTLRGKFLARAGRPADAVKAWKEVIATHPGDEGLREDLIELEIGEGMLDEAVAAATELADKTGDPYQKALRQMRVAEILSQAGKKNEAVEKYRTVFAVSAESSWLEREVLARVNALFSRDDDTAGLRTFYDQLRETYPRRVVVKKEAARSLMASGDGDEAVAMFREVLKVLPGDREARDEFIAMLEGAGRNKEAAEEITSLLKTTDADAALWEKLAGIRKAMGDDAGLKAAVEKAVSLAPEGEAGKLAAAAIFERYGFADDAERVLREAIKAHGLQGEAGDALAVMLANRGKPDEAVGMWREMAKTADREGLLRIVRSLTANGHATDAYGILSSRTADFPGDPLLLAAICQAAQFADQADDAIPHALELVRQAKTTGDLEGALRQALALVFRAKEPRKWIDELAAKQEPSTQELCLLAEMNETLGDSIEADRILKKAVEGGDPLLAAAQRVRLFELRGDFNSAITATRDWLAMPGGLRTEQVKRLVNLHERIGDMEAALKETENWKRIAPGDKLAWAKRAELYQADGKPEEAVAELRRALAKFGNEEEMRAKLAVALSEAGMEPESWRMYYNLYDEAESPASKLKWAGSLADLAAREGKEEDIIADFKRRARDNPSSVVPLLALAEMYRQWLQPEEELKSLAEASRRKPDDVSLLQRLADIEEETGSPEKAEALLKSAIRLQDTPENRRRLSAFWIRSGDSERGLAELLATKGAASPRDTEKLVLPLVTAKDWDSVLKILSDEAPRHPEDWRLTYLYAGALQEAGRKNDAFGQFTKLLEAKGDLTGVLPLVPANQMGWWYNSGKSKMSDFLMFARFRVMTQSGGSRMRQYYGMNQPGIPLPGTPEEARWMALCQALAIVSENPETRDARLASLTAGDFAGLEFIKSVHDLKPDELRDRMMADNPDPKLFRWYVESQNFDPYQRQVIDNKVLRRGVDVCSGKDPELALMMMVRLPLEGEDGLGAEGARQMLDAISGLDEEKRLEYLSSLQSLTFGKDSVVPKEVREKAESLILADLKTMQQKFGNAWLAESVALQWMREGRMDDAVKLINESYELGKIPSKKANPNMAMQYRGMGMYGWGGRGQGENLAFPQVLISVVSQAFQSEFNLGNSNSNIALSDDQKKLLKLLGEKPGRYPGQMDQEEKKEIDHAGLAKIIPRIADPYLRVFLTQAVEKPELLEKEIASLEASNPQDSKALGICAAYQVSVAKDPVKAFALLAKACQFATAAGGRDALDWQLYQLGLGLVGKDNAGLDLDPARRAALRLRKSMSADEDSKRQLAADMVKLGLEEESKRYVAAPKRIIGSSSPYAAMSGRFGMRSGRNNNLQEITNLISQGKRDAATRMAMIEMRRVKAGAAMNPNNNYEERQLSDAVLSLKLADDIISKSKPSDGAGFNTRRDYALLLTQFKKPDLALPILRELAKERPKDMDVTTALLGVLPKEEQMSQVQKMLDGKTDFDQMGTWFNTILNRDGNETFDEVMGSIGIFVAFLEKLEPSLDPERNLTWVNYFSQRLFDNYSFDDIRLKPFRANQGSSGKYDEARTKERDALAVRLYAAMLRQPQTCQQGFILMHQGREFLGTSDADLMTAARSAVKQSYRLKPDKQEERMYGGRAQTLWMWRSPSGGMGGGSPENSVDPLTYLFRQSAENSEAYPLTGTSLLEMTGADSEMGKSVAECLRIVESPGLDAFKGWKEKLQESPEDAVDQLLWIGRLASLRKRADLLDASLEFATDIALGKVGKSRGQGNGEVTEMFGMVVSGATGMEAKMKVIDRIIRSLLGPPEAWELYGDPDRNQAAYAIQSRVGIFQQFCQNLQYDRESLVALSRFVAENRIPTGSNLSLRNRSNLWRTGGDAVATTKDWISSGIFSPGPAPAGTCDGNDMTLIEDMENLADNMGTDSKKKFGVELLKVDGPERFWARFLGARLTNQPAEALKELDKEADKISKWPAHCRTGLAKTITNWFPDSEKAAGSKTKRLLADARKSGDSESRKLAETYLKDGFPPDMQPYSISNGFGVTVRRVLADDPALAVKLWLKALDFFQNSRQGFSSSSNGISQTPSQYANAELLQALVSGKTDLPTFIGFVVLLEKERKDSTKGMFDSNSIYYLRSMFDTYQQGSKVASQKDKALSGLKPDARTIAGFLLKLHDDTDKEARALVAGVYLMYALYHSNSIDSSSLPGLVEWIRKDLRKLNPELADAALIAVRKRSGKGIPEEELKEIRGAFCNIVSRAEVPAMFRVSSISNLLGSGSGNPWFDDPSCSKALADLLMEITSPGSRWTTSESITAFTCLSRLKSTAAGDATRLMASLKANPPETGNNGSGNELEESISGFMLPLAMRSGDRDSVIRLVKTSDGVFRGNLATAMKLWQGNYPEPAVSLLARPGEYHRGMRMLLTTESDGGPRIPNFNRATEAALTGWLASIPDPGQRFRVECLISSASDATGDAAPEKKRVERIEALVKRFATEAPPQAVSRNEVLAVLGNELVPAKALSAEYEAAVGNQTLGILLSFRDGNNNTPAAADASYVTERVIRLAMRYAYEERGDMSLAVAQFGSINPVPRSNQEYYAREMIEANGAWFSKLMINKLFELPEDQRSEVAKQALVISGMLLDKGRDNSLQIAVGLSIISQVAAADGKALDEWYHALSDDLRKKYDSVQTPEAMRSSIGQVKGEGPFGKGHEDRRLAVLTKVLSDPAMANRIIRHMTDISQLMDYGVFTKADLFKVIDALPEDFPRRGEFLCEKAGIIGWRGGKPEEALAAYDAAEAACAGDAKKIDFVKSYRVMYLDNQKRIADALVVAKTVDLKNLPDRERKTVEGVLKKETPKDKKE